MKGFNLRKINLGLLFALLTLSSCIQENPLLVSPPPKSETVKVRFLNLSSDKNQKTLSMNGTLELSGVNYGTISQSIQPPSDSVTLFIKSNGVQEFKNSQLIRFLGNTDYTFVGLSSLNCPAQNCGIDTIIALRTTLAVDQNSTDAYVKVLNAFADSAATYSLHLGCPNGDVLTSGLRYLSYSFQPFLMPSGIIAVSLVKNSTAGDELINLYELNLSPRGQYSFIISRDPAGKEEALLLDEVDQTVSALTPVQTINERTTNIRLINLSQFNATATSSAGSVIASDQAAVTVGSYNKVTACGGNFSDTLNLFSNGNFKNSVPAQLVVLEKYSFIAFDSTGNNDLRGIFVQPISKDIKQSGKSYIRVVNSSLSAGPLTVSLGARYKPSGLQTDSYYESGLTLASPINFGEISGATILSPGQIPITVFTASGSGRLVFTGLDEVKPDKSYLMVITDGSKGEIEISLIDDDDENQPIQFVKRGSFVQFINAIPNASYVEVSATTSFGMLMQKSKIYYTDSFGTVMDAGDNMISIDNVNYNFNCPADKRIIIISSGTAASPVIFDNLFDAFTSNNTYRIRFANAAADLNLLDIRQNDTTSAIVESVYYKNFSSFQTVDREASLTYYFFNDNNNANLFRLSDLKAFFGKSYNVIFAGNSSYGYTTIKQQDF